MENTFKFRTSISRESYPDKATAKACLSATGAKKIGKAKMAFKEQEVTVQEFVDYAVSGYAFCNLFNFDSTKQYWVKSGTHKTKVYPTYHNGQNKGYFKLSFKADEYFKGSQTVFVDVDYTNFTEIKDYINCLRYQPTCAYTSYSDKQDKNGIVSRRFRLVYVFDSVLSAEEFKNATFGIYDSICKDTQEPMYDLCGCSYSQYMNGSNSQEAYITNTIYSIKDFPKYEVTTTFVDDSKKKAQKITFTDELVKDMETLDYEFVVRKWHAKGLRYFTQTPIEFTGDYAVTDDDFVRLMYIRGKIQDGNHRRKKLYIRAALRRLMKDTTPDELLYNLYIDRFKFFDNTDEAITVEVLQNKVKAAFMTDLEGIKLMADGYKPKFVINPNVTDKRKAVGTARKAITDETIGNIYDCSKSIKDNLNDFKAYGVKVSLSRLYKWCEDNGITPTKTKEIKGYNPNLSVRQNMKVMGCTLYQVMKAKQAYNA